VDGQIQTLNNWGTGWLKDLMGIKWEIGCGAADG
jgi:hypothetical protein